MAYFKVGDPEALTECPYDKTHMVRNKRMQYHLIDCRKNHSTSDVKVCPYNAKHIHPSAEHHFHLVHCPDRILIDRDIIYESAKDLYDAIPDRPKGYVFVPSYDNVNNSDAVSEDWESEACAESFTYSGLKSCSRKKPENTDAVPAVMRQPIKVDPDVVHGNNAKAVTASELEARRQPRQSNASFDSMAVGRSSASHAVRLTNHGSAPAVTMKNGLSTPGLGRGQLMAMMAANSTAAMPGTGRGTVNCSGRSDICSSVGLSSVVGPSVGRQHASSSSSLPNDQRTQKRIATVTTAFSLPGIGRGHVLPPSAQEVPMPTFM